MENEEFSFAPTGSVAKETPVAPVTVPEMQPTMQSAPAENPELKVKKKKSKAKFWLIFGISSGVVVTAVIAVIVATLVFGSKYIEKETDIMFFTTSYYEVIVCSNGEELDTDISGKHKDYISSISGDTAMFSVVDKYAGDGAPGELYAVYDDDVIKISDEAKTFRLAAEGETAAYITNSSALQKVDLDSEKTTYIADEVGDYAISPDGSAIAYTIPSYGMTEVYYFNGKENILIDDNFPSDTSILGLSDKGDYIFIKSGAEEDTGVLYRYSRKENESVKLCDNFKHLICFNYDCTQILYTTTSGSTRLVRENEDITNISAETVTPHISSRVGFCERIYGIKNLCDSFYSSSNFGDERTLYFVDKNGSLFKLAEDVSQIRIAHNGKAAYFLNDEKSLCRLKAKSTPSGVVLAKNIETYELSTDSKRIYFTKDGKLYYGLNEMMSWEVSSSVSNIYVIGDDVCVFICDTGVYICRDGRGTYRAADPDVQLYCYANSAFYYKTISSDMYELYGTDGEDEFELIASAGNFNNFN